jgi:hypothetical protein
MTTRYGIKLDGGRGDYLMSFSEHTNGAKNLTPVTFESVGDAEEYAQDHEIKNFSISLVRPTSEGSRTLAEGVS